MTSDDFPFLSHDGRDPGLLAEAVRDSHALLKLAEKSAGIGIWDTELATDLVQATPTFFRIMGLPPAAGPVPNDTVRAVRHPDDAPRVVKGFRKALAQGLGHYEVEYRIIRPSDGALRWIFGRGRVVRDKAGRPVRYSGVDMDITDRKRAEQQLRESEERFSKAFNAAAHPMSITTLKDGRYVDINAAGLAASELTRDQVIGRTVRDLGFYNDAEIYRKIRELIATKGRFTDLETTSEGPARAAHLPSVRLARRSARRVLPAHFGRRYHRAQAGRGARETADARTQPPRQQPTDHRAGAGPPDREHRRSQGLR